MPGMTAWLPDDTWIECTFTATLTNSAVGASDITATLDPSIGNRLLVWGAEWVNGDTVARTATIVINATNGAVLTPYPATSINAAAVARIPLVGGAAAAAGNAPEVPGPYPMSGAMSMVATMAAVALSQDATFRFLGWFQGSPPTVTWTGGGVFAITGDIEPEVHG